LEQLEQTRPFRIRKTSGPQRMAAAAASSDRRKKTPQCGSQCSTSVSFFPKSRKVSLTQLKRAPLLGSKLGASLGHPCACRQTGYLKSSRRMPTGGGRGAAPSSTPPSPSPPRRRLALLRSSIPSRLRAVRGGEGDGCANLLPCQERLIGMNPSFFGKNHAPGSSRSDVWQLGRTCSIPLFARLRERSTL